MGNLSSPAPWAYDRNGAVTGFVNYIIAYFVFNLQLSYTTPDDRFTVAAFVNNLEDNNVVGYSQPNPQGPSMSIWSLRPPRTYGVRVGARF
jgi:iron complex outermembrane recepter protein